VFAYYPFLFFSFTLSSFSFDLQPVYRVLIHLRSAFWQNRNAWLNKQAIIPPTRKKSVLSKHLN